MKRVPPLYTGACVNSVTPSNRWARNDVRFAIMSLPMTLEASSKPECAIGRLPTSGLITMHCISVPTSPSRRGEVEGGNAEDGAEAEELDARTRGKASVAHARR